MPQCLHISTVVPDRAEKSCISTVFGGVERSTTSFVARRPASRLQVTRPTRTQPKTPRLPYSSGSFKHGVHIYIFSSFKSHSQNGLLTKFQLISSSGSPARPSLPLYPSPGLYWQNCWAALSRFWLAVRAVASSLGVPGHHKWVPPEKKKLHGEDREVMSTGYLLYCWDARIAQ